MSGTSLLSQYRTVAGVVMAITLWMTISYTQTLFDRSDRRKAVTLLLEPVDGGGSMAAALIQANGGVPPACEPSIDNSLAGTVSVRCPTDAGEMAFSVDLVKKVVRPINDRSLDLWRSLGRSAP